MKNRQVNRLATKLMVAVVLFCQAVFLLAPIGYVFAQASSTGEVITDTTPPSMPTGLVITNLTSSQIKLNWTASIDNTGVVGYYLYRSQNAIWSQVGQPDINSYLDYSVVPGAAYYYKVVAVDAAGNLSPASVNLFINVPASALTYPLAPSNLTFIIDGNDIILNWTDNSNNESGFKIYRGPVWTDIGNVGPNVTTYTNSNLASGNYNYKIQAFVNTSGSPLYSPVSNETAIITVGNVVAANASTSATSTPPADASSTEPTDWIDFYQSPSFLSTSSKIFARTNVLTDRVDFTIQNYGSFLGQFQSAMSTDGYRYYAFNWDLNNFSNNTYQLKVSGTMGTTRFDSPSISIQIIKPVTSIDLNKSATSTLPTEQIKISTSTIIKQPATISLVQPTGSETFNGWEKLTAYTYGPIRQVEIFKIAYGLITYTTKLGNATLNNTSKLWEYGWDTTTTPDGEYVLEAIALDDQGYKIKSNKVTVKLNNVLSTNPPTTQQPTKSTPPATPVTGEPINSNPEPNQPQTTSPAFDKEKPIPLPTESIKDILQTAAPIVDERCRLVGIGDKLRCDNFLNENKLLETRQIKTEKTLPMECQNADIKTTGECEMLMRTEYLAFECKQAGLTTKAKCRDFMLSRFGKPASCAELSDLACQKLISQVILADFVDQKSIDLANTEAGVINGKYLELIQAETGDKKSQASIKEDTATLSKTDTAFNPESIRNIEKMLPFAKSEKRLGLMILSSTDDSKKSKMLVSANVLIDSDADGLTDDIEARLGTDFMNSDSDSDGYSDGIEVRNGHNPEGAGELQTTLKPMELAIVNKVKLEQPKLSGETRADILKIQKITNDQPASSSATSSATSELKLQGRALPDDVVSLYIYSVMPIVVTVATDENGNWTYNLDKSLVDGKHEAYVVINDEAGKIKAKSAPFSFFVKEAKAVSQNDFLGGDFAVPDRTTELTGWYISGSLLLIVVALGGYLLYQKTKEKKIIYSK